MLNEVFIFFDVVTNVAHKEPICILLRNDVHSYQLSCLIDFILSYLKYVSYLFL